MDIVIVGDLFIPCEWCRAEMEKISKKYNIEYNLIDWKTRDLEDLNEKNINIEKNGPGAEETPEELRQAIKNARVLIVHFCPVSEELLKLAHKLELIGTMRTGLSNIDLEAARKKGIEVVNLPGRLADSVSDFTVGLMLAEIRNIARSHEALRKGRWEKQYANIDYCFELSGKVVGLIGFGEIGKKTAHKLQNFDVDVLIYDPYVDDKTAENYRVRKSELKDLLQTSDIISIHLPLNDSTRGMIGNEELALMKRTAFIINTARAEIIAKDALIDALETKSIGGAALDVFWDEPLNTDDPILHLDNITVTSHLAGSTVDALSKCIIKLNKRLSPYYETLFST